MICPSCGNENIAGTDYCTDCNTDLRDLDLPVGQSRVEQGLMSDPIAGLIPRDPLKVAPETSVREVIRKLVDTGRNCALVVQHDKMVGIFTERDILMDIAGRYDELADCPVKQFMTPDPERLRPTDTVAFGLNRMMVGDYRHLPIEGEGKALGVVSVRHIVSYLADRYPDVLESDP